MARSIRQARVDIIDMLDHCKGIKHPVDRTVSDRLVRRQRQQQTRRAYKRRCANPRMFTNSSGCSKHGGLFADFSTTPAGRHHQPLLYPNAGTRTLHRRVGELLYLRLHELVRLPVGAHDIPPGRLEPLGQVGTDETSASSDAHLDSKHRFDTGADIKHEKNKHHTDA